jgi:hypothetical protein
MRVALDTNVLAYAEGGNGPALKQQALEVLERLPQRVYLQGGYDYQSVCACEASTAGGFA